jgi:streptogramin lyase
MNRIRVSLLFLTLGAGCPDGNIWFTEQQAGKIGRFLPP